MRAWVAKERVGPGPPSNAWVVAVILVAGVAFLALAVMGLSPLDRVAAEDQYRQGDGIVQALQSGLTASLARLLSAAAAAVAVLATAFAARRLLHDEWASVLAAGLLVLDPSFLVHGRLATPVAPATAAALVALALFLSDHRHAHWWGAVALAWACFLDPVHILWGPVLAVLALMRGHIYAAPQHAYLAGTHALVIPGVGALLGMGIADSLAKGCYLPSRGAGLLILEHMHLGESIYWLPNPAIWFAGIGAVLYLGLTGAYAVLRDFRVQRLPGRIQARLPEGLKRAHGRGLWLLALAIFAPTPALFLPVFTMALALASRELAKDSKPFGVALAVALIVFGVLYTIRLWPLLIGTADAETASRLLQSVPWSREVSC